VATFSVAGKLRAKYDDYYDGTITEWRRLGAIGKADNIVALCREHPHATVLEVGFGDGAILRRLEGLGFGEAMHGLEISSSGLEAIRRDPVRLLVEARLFNGYDIPYADCAFDLAILSHVVEHVEHPRRLLNEVGRVAAHVFVEVPLEDGARLARDFEPNEEGHINFYSEKTIRLLLQTCGLQILSTAVTNPSLAMYRSQYGTKRLVRYLVKGAALKTVQAIAKWMFTYHCSLLCKTLPRVAIA